MPPSGPTASHPKGTLCPLRFLGCMTLLVSGIISYVRQALLDIKSAVTHQKCDFPELDPLFGYSKQFHSSQEPFQKTLRRRGRRDGFLVKLRRKASLPPLPSVLLATASPPGTETAQPSTGRLYRGWCRRPNTSLGASSLPSRTSTPGSV